MALNLISDAQLDELERQRTGLLDSIPEIEKGIKAGLLTPAQLDDTKQTLKRLEGVLQVYRPQALTAARGRPTRS